MANAVIKSHETLGAGNGAGVAEVNGKTYAFSYSRNVYRPEDVAVTVKQRHPVHGSFTRVYAPSVSKAIAAAIA